VLFSGLQGEEAFFRRPTITCATVDLLATAIRLLVHQQVRVAGLIGETTQPYFDGCLKLGVDEMGWDDMSKNEMRWPSIQECTPTPSGLSHGARVSKPIPVWPPATRITQDHPCGRCHGFRATSAFTWKPRRYWIHELPLTLGEPAANGRNCIHRPAAGRGFSAPARA